MRGGPFFGCYSEIADENAGMAEISGAHSRRFIGCI